MRSRPRCSARARRSRRPAGRCRSSAASRCCPTAARCCSARTSARSWQRSRRSTSTSSASTARPGRRTCATRSASSESSPLPVHCIPNAGLPLQGPNGETIFPEEPEPLANALGEFVERYGLSIVGGCCGTTPEHIGAIAERVNGRKRSRPTPRPRRAPAPQQHDRGDPARAGPPPDTRRRAGQLTGLAQGEGAAAGRRL